MGSEGDFIVTLLQVVGIAADVGGSRLHVLQTLEAVSRVRAHVRL